MLHRESERDDSCIQDDLSIQFCGKLNAMLKRISYIYQACHLYVYTWKEEKKIPKKGEEDDECIRMQVSEKMSRVWWKIYQLSCLSHFCMMRWLM